MRRLIIWVVPCFAFSTFTGCTPGGGDDNRCDATDPDCPTGEVCESTVDDEPRCAIPVVIRGKVVNIVDDSPIEGALVQAVDINGAAVGTSAETDADGDYELTVPAARDLDGAPVEGSYTLRVQAHGFQEFPTAIRPALPLDAATALQDDGEWVIENTLTTVKLIALLGDTSQLGSISGTILADPHAGIMVVAEGGGAALIGFSNSDGDYTIFNVPAGAYTVQGYAAGVQLDSAAAVVAAGESVTGVDLSEEADPLNTVSGNVQIVNAPGGSVTSVVLAVESTFVEEAARGTVPPGLRVGNVTGAFTISNVPDGRYVVLAAFENDGLVRDPDENIGGTQIVHIQVPDPVQGNNLTISEGFKITGALAVIGPGADLPEEVPIPTPTLTWADDSSEDGYVIRVFDAFGTLVWTDEIGPTTGSATVSHVYAGPPLRTGLFYQFRVTSFRTPGGDRTNISTTEDLRGVFYYLGL
jgi:hypothetical protein